jgi:predicted dehydrogenase
VHKKEAQVANAVHNTLGRALRYGMVGGGPGAFIGDVHRKAIDLDGSAKLVAGVFSRTREKSLEIAPELEVEEARVYASAKEMAEAEAGREDGIDFVVIVTPNSSHYEIAKSFLEAGIHVVCDKPLTVELAEAEELAALAEQKKLLFGVTYTYTGYPMVKEAKNLISSGKLGEIRFVNAEYPQEWLATPLETTGENRQASWRTDPTQAGKSNCVGDIGSHVENMISYVTGLEIEALCARLDHFVEGRSLDDNATIMVNYKGGARGLYWSSQIAFGHDNGLRFRIFGTEGGLEFSQEHPNHLTFTPSDGPKQIISRGRDAVGERAAGLVRIPAGHPEGYFEAFANIYLSFAEALAKRLANKPLSEPDFPTVGDGVNGVKFIGRVVESAEKGATWINF